MPTCFQNLARFFNSIYFFKKNYLSTYLTKNHFAEIFKFFKTFMDNHQSKMKPSSSYEQIQPYKILLHQLTTIGGKKFLEAANEYFSSESCQNNRKNDAQGDRLLSPVDTNNSNTVIRTLYSNQARESLDTPSMKIESLASYGARKTKQQKLWKPHYETATKITEIRRNENVNLRTNMQVESLVPFIAGTSLSRSHNILLNCQHVMAQLKRAQVGAQPNGRSDAVVSHGPEQIRQDSSEIIAKLPHSKFHDDVMLNFKAVLQHLYEEYTNLSREYDELVKVMSIKGINKKYAKQEAKNLEQALDRKEQEIMMLIILYQEIINLTDEAKKKASKMKMLKGKPNAVSLSSSTDFKLKFLLHQIQKFEKLLINRN